MTVINNIEYISYDLISDSELTYEEAALGFREQEIFCADGDCDITRRPTRKKAVVHYYSRSRRLLKVYDDVNCGDQYILQEYGRVILDLAKISEIPGWQTIGVYKTLQDAVQQRLTHSRSFQIKHEDPPAEA